jgi:hypothetical protein
MLSFVWAEPADLGSAKGQSRKDFFEFSFAPKNERKYFCISALASKKRSSQKNKGTLYTDFLIDGRRSTIGGIRLGG